MGLTPLVGREEELGLLQRRWAQAKEGAGQVVLLSGEAGIGKSRLVQTLKEQVLAEGATRIEFRCSPYHQNSAFYPSSTTCSGSSSFSARRRRRPNSPNSSRLSRPIVSPRPIPCRY